MMALVVGTHRGGTRRPSRTGSSSTGGLGAPPVRPGPVAVAGVRRVSAPTTRAMASSRPWWWPWAWS